jgi:tetratricopeptide (TPR) repeat protein
MDLENFGKGLKDRITCIACNKAVVSTNGRPVPNCPHCGAWLPVSLWMSDKDVEDFAKVSKASDKNRSGISLMEARRFDEAIQAFDEGLAIDPTDASIWNNKSVALNRSERYNEALTCCDKAISINPRDLNPWKNKCSALNGLGRSAEAIKAIDKVLAVEPKDAQAMLAKGIALCDLGQKKEGIAWFKKADALGLASAKIALRSYQVRPWWKIW